MSQGALAFEINHIFLSVLIFNQLACFMLQIRNSEINRPVVGQNPLEDLADKVVDEVTDTVTDTVDRNINSDDEEQKSIEEAHRDALKDFYYFNKGFKGDELATNFTACGNRSAYWYYYELATIQVKLRYSTAEESTFNSTLFIQNTTNTAYICTDTAENIYFFYLWKRE